MYEEIQAEVKKLDFDTKPELTGTEKHFESHIKQSEKETPAVDIPSTNSDIISDTKPSEDNLGDNKNNSTNLEKYSVKNKSKIQNSSE